MSDSSSECCTPPKLCDAVMEAVNASLPAQSKERYQMVYDNFKTWCKRNKVQKSSENVLLAYFSEKSKVYKSSTLWSHFSVLKSTLSANDNVNIDKYSRLISFLKRKSDGFRSKKSKSLTREEFYKFLIDADNTKYLMMKVSTLNS